MAILALLTVCIGAYLLLPRWIDGWTRQEAVAYLRAFTGGVVDIREASFGLFGGIELRGVSIDVPNSPLRERFLEADTVVLRHRPWSLLTDGRLEPTEIVCIGPTVTLGYDAEKGRYTIEELIAAARRARRPGADGAYTGRLPVVSVRDVRLRLLTGETRVDISLVPLGRSYRIVLEEQRPAGGEPLRALWTLDLSTGRFVLEESKIPKLSHTDSILPQQYAEWRKRYNIRGKVVLRGKASGAPDRAILDAELENVALQLRPAEGGLELAGVCGTLSFHEDAVIARDLTGRIPQAGDAKFRMSGRYGGYDPNSPFDLHVTVEGMVVPDGSGATGWLAEALKFINRTYRPVGKLDIAANFRRGRGGRVDMDGSARPLGMSFLFAGFPYRMEEATGSIDFLTDANTGRVTLTQLTGRRGRTEVTVRGTIDLRQEGCYDVTVSAKDVPLDAELRSALPEPYRPTWDEFSPAGTTAVTVRVWRRPCDPSDRAQVAIAMDGRSSMAYRGFPYRLEELSGEVRIDANLVTVDSVRGRRGSMLCTVDGVILGPHADKGETNLTVEATNVPLDAALLEALPDEARKAAASLHASGLAERVSARLRQPKDQPLDLRVVVRVKDAAFRPDAFPYAVEAASGVLTIRSGRIIVEDVAGSHGRTRIGLSGQVLLGAEPTQVDLHVRAAAVEFDEALYAALPAETQRVWRKLAPSGQADLELSIRQGLPDARRDPDYRLVLQARGMAVRYEDFPYTLEAIVGRAVATPAGVKLEGLTAQHGRARLTLQGDLVLDGNAETASLSIQGSDVPIDEELLGAMPATLGPLASRFQPGGTCELDLKSFRISRSAPPATQASSRPSGAASLPARPEPVQWSVDGRAAFQGATIDVGLGAKTLSGSLQGAAAQSGGDLSVDAAVELDSVQVGRQKLTSLKGRLAKKPGSLLMRLSDLSARAHGGQVAGFAEMRLTEPLEFGVSLSVDGIQLQELFQAAPGGRDGAPKVAGSLAGNLQLTAVAGDKPRRQAAGVLRIYRAELYKLPVLLDLLHVVFLSLPGETAFTDGTLAYHLRNDKLVFDEIYLRGPALSIVGSGTMNMQTEALDLIFLSGPPQKLPRLGGLSDVLEGIAREVAQIHVGGTLRQPEMRPVPLRSLDRLVRDLLDPGRTK